MSDTEFESFVMNAGPDILRFCRIITNNKEQGDELYQDAMVLLLEKRASLKAEQNSKSYALSVAVLLWKNKKKKYANRMRIAPVSSLEEHQETVSSFAADWDTTPEQMMINKQEIAEVRNAVQMLPEKYRIPICLSYSAGLTMEEIATCMKVPVNTVKTRIRKIIVDSTVIIIHTFHKINLIRFNITITPSTYIPYIDAQSYRSVPNTLLDIRYIILDIR